MILSSLLAEEVGGSGAEGKRALSSSASDTGQFSSLATRWLFLVVLKRVVFVRDQGREIFCDSKQGEEVKRERKKKHKKKTGRVSMQTTCKVKRKAID